jgi:RHS repeat-associated protein
LGLVILLAEHDESSLAAKKKQRPVALGKATSTPKNRVWNFFGSALGRTCSEPDLSAENATGSVQFSYETASGRGYYYTRDHLGSVREMCSSTGTITSRMSYDPYGRVTTVSGTILPTKQYAGYYYHATSGLDMTLYRATYDANLGRWLNRDPKGEKGGLNLYEYCDDDSVGEIDPLGLQGNLSITLTTPTIYEPGSPSNPAGVTEQLSYLCKPAGCTVNFVQILKTDYFWDKSYNKWILDDDPESGHPATNPAGKPYYPYATPGKRVATMQDSPQRVDGGNITFDIEVCAVCQESHQVLGCFTWSFTTRGGITTITPPKGSPTPSATFHSLFK